jgi:D-alanyl-D-alanine-carboxypeptidase/D-alanyl-D-alanine-endopeptidase
MRRTSALLPALAAAALSAVYAPGCAAQTGTPPAAAGRHFPADADLQVMLDYLVEDRETPGIILGMIEADGSTRILQAGSAGPGTVFEIGSINKTFTATVLADMVAKGEVALEDPVQKYLPEGVRVPSRNDRQITLLDLTTHAPACPGWPATWRPRTQPTRTPTTRSNSFTRS